jgi:hypothetical protein
MEFIQVYHHPELAPHWEWVHIVGIRAAGLVDSSSLM